VKALVKYLFFVFLVLCANSIFAQDASKDSGKLTRAEKRDALSKKIGTLENGDIVIERPKIPKWDAEETAQINRTFLILLSYINPKTDIKKFAKALKSKAPDTTGYITSLKTVMPAVMSAFGTENINFTPITFTANTARTKIDSGIPLFAWFLKSDHYANELTERTHLRPLTGDMKDWSTRLRKTELKNMEFQSSGRRATVVPAIIVGYNKSTDEYLVRFDEASEIWMTTDEIKKSANVIYNLRL